MQATGKNSLVRFSVCATLVCCLFLTASWPQATSSITGSIRDPSGALIPAAEVSVANLVGGSVRTTVTNASGYYRVTNLIPGQYRVTASLTGFKTAVAPVEVTVGQVSHVELTLEIGEISEQVIVTNAATAVDVEQGRVSSLVDEQRIQDLPLNGRNVYELMRLAPGAVDSRATVFEAGQGTSVNGGRVTSNGFWMDGITSKGLSGGIGNEDLASHPNLEAVREFRIETLNFSAEFGNSVGSIVNVVSKRGGNELHGSLFAFHRNDNLDARQFFDRERPEFIQNQFGFSLGGPVVKDRTFFFGSYEGTRIRRSRTRLDAYESPEWAGYVTRYGAPVARFLYANYPAPAVDTVFDTSVGEYLARGGYLDSPDQAAVDEFLGSAFGSPPGAIQADAPMVVTTFLAKRSFDKDGYSLRLDQELGDADRVYGRYFLTDSHVTSGQLREALSWNFAGRAHQAALNWTHILSPLVVNEARIGFTRNVFLEPSAVAGLPRIADGGFVSIFEPDLTLDFTENIFTWADTLSLNRENHGLRMGAEVRRNQENSEFDVGRASYYFFDLVYLALDAPYYQAGGVDPRFDLGSEAAELSSNLRGWRGTEIGLFVNDDWKALPNLSLNLGIRWDWYGRLNEVQNRATAFDMSRGTDIFERVYYGKFEAVDQLSADDWNNLAPRIGFAWDPFRDGKMSVRGGYGVAYQSGIFNPLANSRWNKPFYSFNLACDRRFPEVCGTEGQVVLYGPQDGSPVRVDGPNPNPGVASTRVGNIAAWDSANPNQAVLTAIPNPRMRDPYVQSFFLGVQRELFRDVTLEVNYVGTLGRKLMRAEDFNRYPGDLLGAPNPVTGENEGDEELNGINPDEGALRFWENSVNSNYHALQVQLNRRFSGGFAFNVHYTLAKSLDTRSTWHSGETTANRWQEGFSTDVTNVALDYGRSVFDARQRFVTSWLWETPWFEGSDNRLLRHLLGGWQVNGILSLQSGQPFTPWMRLFFSWGGDFNADGTRNDRPNTPSAGNSLSSSRSDFVNPNAGLFNIPSSDPDSPPSVDDILDYFGTPEPGTNGNLGRNTYEGPGYANLDLSFFKGVGLPALGESGELQLRFEFFNLFNRVNLGQPETQIDAPLFGGSTFGRSTDTFDAREIQFGIKVVF